MFYLCLSKGAPTGVPAQGPQIPKSGTVVGDQLSHVAWQLARSTCE